MNIRDKIDVLMDKVVRLQMKVDDPVTPTDIRYECAMDLNLLGRQLDKMIAQKPDET